MNLDSNLQSRQFSLVLSSFSVFVFQKKCQLVLYNSETFCQLQLTKVSSFSKWYSFAIKNIYLEIFSKPIKKKISVLRSIQNFYAQWSENLKSKYLNRYTKSQSVVCTNFSYASKLTRCYGKVTQFTYEKRSGIAMCPKITNKSKPTTVEDVKESVIRFHFRIRRVVPSSGCFTL